MKVFNTKGVTFNWESGEFDCPACGAPEVFWHRSIRRFLTLGPIPVFPLGRLAEFVECQQCGHRYETAVLERDSKLHHDLERAEFAQHVVWVMLLAGLTSRSPNASQAAAIKDVFEKLSGTPMAPGEFERKADVAARAAITPMDYVARFIEVFQDHGRGHVLMKAVERVVAEDGVISERDQPLMDDLRFTIGSGEVPAVRVPHNDRETAPTPV